MARPLYFVGQALGCIRQSPWSAVVASLTVAVALAASVGAYLLVRSAEGGLKAFAADARLTVWLTGTALDSTDDAAGELLAERTRIAARDVAGDDVRVDYVSPLAALARLRAELGESGVALDTLAFNPLPPSLEVRLSAKSRLRDDLAEVKELAAVLGALPFVERVEYGRAFIDRLQTLLLGVRAGGLLLFALVVGLALFVVGVVVRLTIYARREEIEILRLVGATDAFVATPFIVEGAIQGFVGGLGAALLAWTIESRLLPLMFESFGFGMDFLPPPMPDGVAAALVAIGTFVGLASSGVAVVRWLRKVS